MSPQTLNSLRDRYGKELESWWRQSFGYGFANLTENEARQTRQVFSVTGEGGRLGGLLVR